MLEGSITIHLPIDVKEVERVNRIVRQFGELHEVPSRTLYSVNLALDEAITNVILHGFDAGNSSSEITVRLEAGRSDLRSEVADGGRAFNPLEAASPDLTAPLDQRTLGGLGIHLMRSLMDSLEYRREGEKNMLTMRKRIR